MVLKNTISELTFKEWLRIDKENLLLLKYSLVLIVISFSVLKYFYPYPNFISPDSYSYIEAAYQNKLINIWPIGYSIILQIVRSFNGSHLFLVIFQYIILQFALLYFLFTLRYLLSIGKWLFRIILILNILNPLIPNIANFVSSDSIFATLSLIWFTQLLWLLHKTNFEQICIHALVLLLLFTIRYQSLFYPLLSIFIISFSTLPARRKLFATAIVAIPLLAYIGLTQFEYNKKTNTVQYSAFGGWQLAANALYGYAHAKLDQPESMPIRFRELHKIVNRHMDSLNHLGKRPDEEIGVYYLWDFKSPLRVRMDYVWKNFPERTFFQQWATMAPSYGAYGRLIISKHPLLFIKYFVWPNLIRFYAPPSLFMGMYNSGKPVVDPIAVKWFHWKDNTLKSRYNDGEINIVTPFTTIISIVNPLFLLSVIIFFMIAGHRECGYTAKRIIYYLCVFWLTNLFFSILSAPIELRYQLFPMIISTCFLGIIASFILKQLLFGKPVMDSKISSTTPA